MTREEQIALARRIADELPEVKRNEWMRWLQIASKYGLDQALRHAERLSNDITMRTEIKKQNQRIAQAIHKYKTALEPLEPDDQRLVLGYVAWYLVIQSPREREEE